MRLRQHFHALGQQHLRFGCFSTSWNRLTLSVATHTHTRSLSVQYVPVHTVRKTCTLQRVQTALQCVAWRAIRSSLSSALFLSSRRCCIWSERERERGKRLATTIRVILLPVRRRISSKWLAMQVSSRMKKWQTARTEVRSMMRKRRICVDTGFFFLHTYLAVAVDSSGLVTSLDRQDSRAVVVDDVKAEAVTTPTTVASGDATSPTSATAASDPQAQALRMRE